MKGYVHQNSDAPEHWTSLCGLLEAEREDKKGGDTRVSCPSLATLIKLATALRKRSEEWHDIKDDVPTTLRVVAEEIDEMVGLQTPPGEPLS